MFPQFQSSSWMSPQFQSLMPCSNHLDIIIELGGFVVLGTMNYYGGVSKRNAIWKDLVVMVRDCYVKMMIIPSHLIHMLWRLKTQAKNVFKDYVTEGFSVVVSNYSGMVMKGCTVCPFWGAVAASLDTILRIFHEIFFRRDTKLGICCYYRENFWRDSSSSAPILLGLFSVPLREWGTWLFL